MDVLAEKLKISAYGIHITTSANFNIFANVFIYADDILLIARSRFALKQLLVKVMDFCETYGDLALNETKSCIIVLNKGRKKWEKFSIEVKGIVFKSHYCTEYLGVVIGDVAASMLKMKTSLYIKANILKRSAINLCSIKAKRDVFEAYSPVYGIATLSEVNARKISPPLRYLAQIIFKKEIFKYRKCRNLKFVKNRDIFKAIPFFQKFKSMNSILEQWRLTNLQIESALVRHFQN